MSEYICKEDAVEALDGKIVVTGHKNADAVLQYMKDITNKIKSLEPADVVPVVRCRDCREFAKTSHWCESFDNPTGENYIPRDSSVRIVRCKDCIHRDPEDKKCDCGHGIVWQLPRDDNWFCADGKRREG